MVEETFRFTVFRSLEDAFVNPSSWHDLIISSPHVEQRLINLPKNVCPPVENAFGKKVSPYSSGGDNMYQVL